MRHVLIVNPVSGKEGVCHSMVPRLRQAAQTCGVELEVAYTEWARHGAELAARYAAEGPARLYAVGGDGTLNEVLNGAYGHPECEVACVPCGSGNDFVRSFGRVEDFLRVEDLIRGTAIPLDLVQVDGRDSLPASENGEGPAGEGGICAAITSTGLDAEVAYGIPKYRRLPLLGGTMAYNISILEQLLKPLGKRLSVTIDNGEPETGEYLIAAVCNGKTYGGGFCAAPMARLDDGMLDVILVKKVSRLLIAGIIGKYKKGEHWKSGAIVPKFEKIMKYHRAKKVVITPADDRSFILNVDGECGPAPRLYAEVLPLAGRFVLPAGLYAAYGGKK